MKFLILASSLLAVAFASWEQIHEQYHGPLHYPKIHNGVPIEPTAVQHARQSHLMALSQASHGHDQQEAHHEDENKWHGPQHYPVIHKGVPVETAEVQHAREAHLKALSHASHNNHHYDQYQDHDYHQGEYQYDGNHEEVQKWNGPLHYPKIYKGVPVEPVEVQHARAAHLKAVSETHHQGGDFSNFNQQNLHKYETHNHYETPKIGHDGKPVDTLEVEAAKLKHFAAVHDALARNSHGNSHHYRKRRGAESYVHFSNVVDHAVPVYYNKHDDSHYANDDNNSHYHEYSYHQIHAPVYGHHEDEHNFQGNSYDHTHGEVDRHDSHGYSYEQFHAPMYGNHDVHHQHHILVIGHDGTPVDTPEVQHAKAEHLAAHAAAKSKHY